MTSSSFRGTSGNAGALAESGSRYCHERSSAMKAPRPEDLDLLVGVVCIPSVSMRERAAVDSASGARDRNQVARNDPERNSNQLIVRREKG